MSKIFLEDIFEVFELKNTEVKEHHELGKIRGYYCSIGAELFNELLDNYEMSLPRKRIYYRRIVHKFPLTRDELQRLVSENPGANGYELSKIINKSTGIRVGPRTVYEKLGDPEWQIEQITKDDYYRIKIIYLLRKGWKIEKIWENKTEGLGFSEKSWHKNRWRFFKKIFKDHIPYDENNSGIIKRIEELYHSDRNS